MPTRHPLKGKVKIIMLCLGYSHFLLHAAKVKIQ